LKKSITYLRAVLFMILLTAILPGRLSGQVTSPGADYSRLLDYPVTIQQDPLFVFYQDETGSVSGSLTATGPSAGNFDFEWQKYSTSTSAFTLPVGSDTDASTSTISNLDDGGYQVRITNGIDIDTTHIAWVMIDELSVETDKDASGKVPFNKSGCPDGNFLVIGGTAEVDSFSYYDPLSDDTVRLVNDISIKWTSDNPDLLIPNAENKDAMEENYTSDPPVIDTWYILTVTDSLGMNAVDSVLYDTKHTKAEFEVEYWDKINKEWDPGLTDEWSLDKGSLDAPLTVRFQNKSLSGIEFEWVFLDTIEEATGFRFKEEVVSVDTAESPEFTYLTADRFFYPYLVSISDENCTDTFRLDDGIFVEPVTLEIPNFFSPNDDNINDVFIFKHQSIKSFTISIMDRRGKRVYHEDVDDIYEWEGWDGTLISGIKAPDGRYYYIVSGIGYDNQEYKDPGYWERRRLEREGGSSGSGSGTGSTGEDEPQVNTIYSGWLYLYKHKRNQ